MSMTLPPKIVMATGNRGKIKELVRLLAPYGCEVVPQSDFDVVEAEETGDTFVDNAIIKARHASVITGLPALADDSGLAVDALQGRPGVYSARYAGPDASDDDNISLLLEELAAVDANERGAAFHCAACFLESADAEPVIGTGQWPGRILQARQGDGGFGYDPVFFDDELGRSAAELDAEEKNARSHRGQALRALVEQMTRAQ